jgi:hypothetical protein
MKSMENIEHYYQTLIDMKEDLWFICCPPFGPKGGWILGICQHVYDSQCLITLMVAKKRCPQCRAPFH